MALTKPFERKRIKATGCYKQYFKFIKIVMFLICDFFVLENKQNVGGK